MTRFQIRGVKDKKLRELYRLAAKSMWADLVSSRMKAKITVEFSVLTENSRYYGLCYPEDFGSSPRNFCIQIDSSQPLREILRTLAHELVHVKQFARNELYDYIRDSRTRWKNVAYDTKCLSYRKLPWEEEAFKLQTPILRKFLKEHKIDLKMYADKEDK